MLTADRYASPCGKEGRMITTPRQLERRAEFYHQMGTMTEAGLSLLQCLESLNRGRVFRAFAQPISRLIDQLEQGATFAEAAASLRGWLPAFDLALLDSGERSGRLDVCFRLLSEFYRRRARAVREVIQRLLYPALVIHVAVLALAAASDPQRILNGEIGAYLWSVGSVLLPIYLVFFGVFYMAQGSHGVAVRSLLERVFGFVPLLGAARQCLALSRLCLALEALLAAGMPMGRSWALAGEASGSPRIWKAVGPFEAAIEEGRAPGELLDGLRCFPDMFVGMYQSGEASGRLDENLNRLHVYYQEEGFRKLAIFAVWLPRLIYLFILGVVAYYVIRGWVEYYEGILDLSEF